ncbi:MAG: hypothetical protein HC788_04285 [Sphingopyxis sp.]|nr:hypothetical protein [Sphingopyxis sp.]
MADNCDQLLPRGADAPYLLLCGCDPLGQNSGNLEQALRHMGLVPTAGEAVDCDAQDFSGQSFHIKLGDQKARVGFAAAALVDEAYCHAETLWAGTRVAADDGKFTRAVLLKPAWEPSTDLIIASREFFKLAVLLIDLMGADQLFWSPARLWSDAGAFRAAVVEMLDSGMPPLLHLMAFQDMPGGGMATRGLAFFSKQELHLMGGNGLERKDAVRRLARLALDIMVHGPIVAQRRFPGLVEGEHLRLVQPPGQMVPAY